MAERQFGYRYRLPVRNYELKEVLVGYGCNQNRCDFKISPTIPFWEALRLYGLHNVKRHRRSTEAHMTKIWKLMEIDK